MDDYTSSTLEGAAAAEASRDPLHTATFRTSTHSPKCLPTWWNTYGTTAWDRTGRAWVFGEGFWWRPRDYRGSNERRDSEQMLATGIAALCNETGDELFNTDLNWRNPS